MSKPRKRIYLINRDFQMRYSVAAVIVGLLSTILTLIILLFPLYTFEILRIPRFLPLPIFGVMAFAALVNIVLVALMGVFITHRIAGPMYSLVRSFRRVEMGRWTGQLRIRENDDLRYVVRNFNQMLEGLLRSGKSDLEVINGALERLEKGDNKDARQSLEELKARFEFRLKEPEETP